MRPAWLLAAALAAAAPAHAQPPAAPAHASVAAENQHARVLRARLAPGQSTPMHEHSERVVVFLTGAKLEVTLPDGTSGVVERKAGDADIAPPTKHAVRNLAAAPFEAAEIELLAPTAARPLGDAAKEDAKHTVVVAANERVRVLRTKIIPGDAAPMHGHGERVTVILSGGAMRITSPDGTSRDAEMRTGDVSIAAPVRHAAANVGTTLHDAITVELVPTP